MTETKTGKRTLLRYLAAGGILGRRFLDKSIGRQGEIYQVGDVFSGRLEAGFLDGPRVERVDIEMIVCYEGTNDPIRKKVCYHLEDLEILE